MSITVDIIRGMTQDMVRSIIDGLGGHELVTEDVTNSSENVTNSSEQVTNTE